MKINFINPEVEHEVMNDFTLFVLFSFIHVGYDSEIDPIHNSDFVLERKMFEKQTLENLKIKLLELKSNFNNYK